MNEERKDPINSKDLRWAVRELLPLISVCPQVIKPGTGMDAFVEDLKKGAEKYAHYFGIPNK